jgi:hypothetical protein
MDSLIRSVGSSPYVLGFLLALLLAYVIKIAITAKFYRTLSTQIEQTNRCLAGQEARLKVLSEAVLSLRDAVQSVTATPRRREEEWSEKR